MKYTEKSYLNNLRLRKIYNLFHFNKKMLTKEEEKIYNSIVVPSENDPNKPEFPPGNPKFPATPTYKIRVPGFSNVWLKDESVNLTGTHKDRMAWEMVVTYKQFLLSKKEGKIKKLPHLSILSSGSAAFAIQTQLKNYSLPDLHVLIDRHTDNKIIEKFRLQKHFCYRSFSWRFGSSQNCSPRESYCFMGSFNIF